MTLVIATVDHVNYMFIIVYKNLLALLQVSYLCFHKITLLTDS